MPQIFRPRANTIFRWFLLSLPIVFVGILSLVGAANQSDFVTRANFFIDQEVPFSHRHHVSGLGIDCRYCHVTVETQRAAFVPGADTCMNCHTYIWKDAPILEPVRKAYYEGTPLKWKRVNDLPDFVYFHHGIHVQKGVSCVECHGHMEDEALTAKAQEFNMQWCLDCHLNPAPHLRPRAEVFNMKWKPGVTEEELGKILMKRYGIQHPTDCWRCHR